MDYRYYSKEQLETEAEYLLKKYDPQLLYKPKEIDVYHVVEKCLAVDYSWHYIRPDQKILGLTAFQAGYIWVSPTPYVYEGIKPVRVYLNKGDIVIDTTLTYGTNVGRENFTVMHEVFHQVLHKEIFQTAADNCIHFTKLSAPGEKTRFNSSLDIIEYQANACAAAFLMPRSTVPDIWQKVSGYGKSIPECYVSEDAIYNMSEIYQVSKQATRYRLMDIGLIK